MRISPTNGRQTPSFTPMYPEVCRNGQKFYIVFNGQPTAIKLVDTYITASGAVRGHFKCADGREFYDGSLRAEYDSRRSPSRYVVFTDEALRKKEDYSMFKITAYSSLDDLRAQRDMITHNLTDIDVCAPMSKILPTDGRAEDGEYRTFRCCFYMANMKNGSVTEYRTREDYERIINVGGKWFLAFKGTSNPIIEFPENYFSSEFEAKAYIARVMSESEVVDFDDEPKTEKPKTITISIHVGDVEQKEVIPMELLDALMSTIHRMN